MTSRIPLDEHVANLLCVLCLCGVLACSEDPHTILDACNLPQPCGPVGNMGDSPFLIPIHSSVCIHDVLAQSAPAHLMYRWGGISRDLYTAASGTAVLISTICRGEDGKGPCDDDTVERGTLQPVEEFECVGCPQPYDCSDLLQPSGLVCGGFTAWLSDREPSEPACP